MLEIRHCQHCSISLVVHVYVAEIRENHVGEKKDEFRQTNLAAILDWPPDLPVFPRLEGVLARLPEEDHLGQAVQPVLQKGQGGERRRLAGEEG